MKNIIILIIVLFLPYSAAAGLKSESGKKEPKTDKKIVRHYDLRAIQDAFNSSDERENVKTYKYNKDRIYKIPLREFMHTVIRLPANERLKAGFVLGDNVNFRYSRIDKNTFEVWGEHPGADTSLTVFGYSGNIYSFYLKNYPVEANQLPDLTVYITGRIKETSDPDEPEAPAKQAEKLSNDYLRELTRTDPTQHTYGYEIGKGNADLKPLRVFDDGHFTYFQIAESNLDSAELPQVYAVINGYDTPVQTRVKGGFLIATTVNDRWTVRNGDKFLCVRRTE